MVTHLQSAPDTPLDAAQRQQVILRTRECIQLAETLFGRRFSRPEICFSLGGLRAGTYTWRRRGGSHISYNPQVFALDFADHLQDTVAHEVAHHVVYQLFGPGIRPHGREWKTVARALGARPRARGDYPVEGVRVRRQRRFDYRCACQEWQLTTTRHKRIQAGAEYRCNRCGQRLVTGAA